MSDPTAKTASDRRRRIPLGGRTLRQHAARGTLINAAFNLGLAGLGVGRRFLIAIFLTAADYGLWGLIFISVSTILWLKDVGISDRFIQQDEENQELAFQKAFTLNLLWTGLFCVLVLVAVPLFSVIYGRPEIILPGCLLTIAVLASAFQSPLWIFYRDMRFVLQRSLQSIEPVVGFVVTMALGIAGASYWSLVVGAIAGTCSAAIASLAACPYPIRLRWQRGTLRDYYSFSWPLVLSAGSGLIVVQAAVIIGEETVGLAGVGAIGLAGTIASFADRVDAIVTGTLYPVICAVRDRVELLFESFVKSNRLALIWGMPFGLGLALFAPDLVEYVLGEKWEVATGLLQVFGVTAAVAQIGFNWSAYHRAVGDTRPIAVNAIGTLVVFFIVGVPGMILWGLTGYAIAIVATSIAQLAIRTYYLSRLFSGFRMLQHTMRALTPCLPAVAAILAVRLVEPASRPPAVVVGELALYTALTGAFTWAMERELVREMVGYLRETPQAAQPA